MKAYEYNTEDFINQFECKHKAADVEFYNNEEKEWEKVEGQLPFHIQQVDWPHRWDEERLMRIKEKLMSVLCDPDGIVCIEGSKGDKKVIQDALAELDLLEKKYAIELIDSESGKHKGEYVGIAPNFARLEMVKDKDLAITFGTIKQAEFFQKYVKKSSGGLDCVISEL